MRLVLVLLVPLLLLGCTDDQPLIDTLPDYSAIEDPRARWEAYGFDAYAITQERACECLPPYVYTVFVEGGRVVALDYEQEEEGEVLEPSRVLTVGMLFNEIGRAEAGGADAVQVRYDPRFGYPADVVIDYDRGTADEELILRLSDLRSIE